MLGIEQVPKQNFISEDKNWSHTGKFSLEMHIPADVNMVLLVAIIYKLQMLHKESDSQLSGEREDLGKLACTPAWKLSTGADLSLPFSTVQTLTSLSQPTPLPVDL